MGSPYVCAHGWFICGPEHYVFQCTYSALESQKVVSLVLFDTVNESFPSVLNQLI